MESPQLLEEGYFWFHRQQNGWPPVPQEIVDAAAPRHDRAPHAHGENAGARQAAPFSFVK